jgi:hypothetical protein
MKNTTLRTIAMLGLFFVLAVASVRAQSSVKIRANIPFDFTAGTAKLKAGKYTIQRSSGKILALRAVNETKDVFVLVQYTVQRTDSDRNGKLVFHRYGNDYFLTETWTSGEPIGNGLNESAAERRVARGLAKGKSHPQRVEILASAK